MRPQHAFRSWAESLGLVVKKQPESLRGEGDVYGVPLNGRHGWIWDAGDGTIGIDYRGSTRAVRSVAEKLQQEPTFRLQTVAVDAVVGRMPQPKDAAFLSDVLGARAKRRLTDAQRMALADRARSLWGNR